MIHIRELQFAYASDGFELHVDELSVGQGERVAWIGPSGAGKTTLLHLVAGITRAATGQIESCGVNLIGLHDAARRNFRISNVGLVFQEFSLVEYLTVLDNILLPYRINRSLRLDASIRTRAEQLATNLGLLPLLSRRPTRLSHGERQRVAVCRALIASPKLILADEPTANLDPDNASRVLDALDQYSRQHSATLVVVTHDRAVLDRFDQTIDVSPFSQQSPTGVGEGSDER
jgi:putative ABC transport system ATP-binding protein